MKIYYVIDTNGNRALCSKSPRIREDGGWCVIGGYYAGLAPRNPELGYWVLDMDLFEMGFSFVPWRRVLEVDTKAKDLKANEVERLEEQVSQLQSENRSLKEQLEKMEKQGFYRTITIETNRLDKYGPYQWAFKLQTGVWCLSSEKPFVKYEKWCWPASSRTTRLDSTPNHEEKLLRAALCSYPWDESLHKVEWKEALAPTICFSKLNLPNRYFRTFHWVAKDACGKIHLFMNKPTFEGNTWFESSSRPFAPPFVNIPLHAQDAIRDHLRPLLWKESLTKIKWN